jgi:hypothetical protein
MIVCLDTNIVIYLIEADSLQARDWREQMAGNGRQEETGHSFRG